MADIIQRLLIDAETELNRLKSLSSQGASDEVQIVTTDVTAKIRQVRDEYIAFFDALPDTPPSSGGGGLRHFEGLPQPDVICPLSREDCPLRKA